MKEYIVPKQSLKERSTKPLLVAFTGIGLVAGLVGRDLLNTGYQSSEASVSGYTEPYRPQEEEVLYEATIARQVYDLLNPTPTATATPKPTSTPGSSPTPISDFCTATPEMGTQCRVPPPPPPEPTPLTDCAIALATPTVYSNKMCEWGTGYVPPTPTPYSYDGMGIQ